MKKGREGDMSEKVPAFQALPGATPENSAFIDLYYDPAVTFIWGNTLSFSINDGQMRLSAGQSVRIAVPPGPVRVVVQVLALSFITPKPQLDFVVYPGQVVPVIYRASILQGNSPMVRSTRRARQGECACLHRRSRRLEAVPFL